MDRVQVHKDGCTGAQSRKSARVNLASEPCRRHSDGAGGLPKRDQIVLILGVSAIAHSPMMAPSHEPWGWSVRGRCAVGAWSALNQAESTIERPAGLICAPRPGRLTSPLSLSLRHRRETVLRLRRHPGGRASARSTNGTAWE